MEQYENVFYLLIGSPMKSLLFLCIISLSLSFSAYSEQSSFIQKRQTAVLSNLFDQLIQREMNSEMAIEKSVNALLESYPEQISLVLQIAINKYPLEYKQIICGALRAEPALTSDVIDIVLQSNIASNEDIISFAVKEEPAYAAEIVDAALLHNPLEIENIVRVAIVTEPLMANHVVETAMKSYPEKVLDILAVAINVLPEEVIKLVRNTLRISPDNTEVISVAINSSNSNKSREIISAAIKSGISQESATAAAIAGGAKKADIVKLDE